MYSQLSVTTWHTVDTFRVFFSLYFIKLVQMGVEAYPCNPNTQEAEDLKYETSLGHTARPDIKNKQIYFC